jgi:hypothetical protein
MCPLWAHPKEKDNLIIKGDFLMTFEKDDVPYIGIWSDLRKNYLLEEKPDDYAELVEEKLLIEYLVGIEDCYSKKFDEMVEQQMEREGVNEELKVQNPLIWVGRVNNIRSRVKEILIAELCS